MMMRQRLDGGAPRPIRWRVPLWGGAAALLLLPAVAMRFTAQVMWDRFDFIVFAVMLAAACTAVELGARAAPNVMHFAGVVGAVGTAFLTIWASLAVGFFGDGSPLDLLLLGVLATALVGAWAVGWRSAGLAHAMLAAAVAQLAVGAIAAIAGEAEPVPTIACACLWLLCAGLFRGAARRAGTVI